MPERAWGFDSPLVDPRVAELAYAHGSGPWPRKGMRVQLPPLGSSGRPTGRVVRSSAGSYGFKSRPEDHGCRYGRLTMPTTNESKYALDVLAPVVARCRSMAGVLRELGMTITGGSHSLIKYRIASLGISTAHFTGQGSNCGSNHSGGPKKLAWEDVLVKGRVPTGREKVRVLRRAMIDSGVPEVCAECGRGPEWHGRPLRLQIDHKDGDPTNNARENLRFLCPNCHSQTPNFGFGNARHPKPPQVKKGPFRGPRPHRRKVDYTQVALRYQEIRNYEAVGKEFNVTGVMVKKIVKQTQTPV